MKLQAAPPRPAHEEGRATLVDDEQRTTPTKIFSVRSIRARGGNNHRSAKTHWRREKTHGVPERDRSPGATRTGGWWQARVVVPTGL